MMLHTYCNLLRPLIKILFLLVPYGSITRKEFLRRWQRRGSRSLQRPTRLVLKSRPRGRASTSETTGFPVGGGLGRDPQVRSIKEGATQLGPRLEIGVEF